MTLTLLGVEVSRLAWSRKKGFHLGVIVVVLAAAAAAMAPALAAPPTPVDAATARRYLAELRVEPESSNPVYDRKKFKHWITISGQCNTRETVLKRDGTDVVTNSLCTPTSGTWYSPYDNVTWTQHSDLDIDHVVPLKEAWESGASAWTNAQREAFANDLARPQLMAVTDNLNQAKGDKDPAQWMPPFVSFQCTYLRAWVEVKHHYNLTVDSLEKNTISSKLTDC